jgi:DNA polymerase alpha subunit A
MIDPDVLLGHNFESVDYGILLHRMKDCKTSHWSKLGRMRRTEWPKGFGRGGTSWGERQIVAGRLICDLSNDMGRVQPFCFRSDGCRVLFVHNRGH